MILILRRYGRFFHSVVKLGDTYVFDPNILRDEALAYWNAEDTNTYVAVEGGRVYGTYILKANQPGFGVTCR